MLVGINTVLRCNRRCAIFISIIEVFLIKNLKAKCYTTISTLNVIHTFDDEVLFTYYNRSSITIGKRREEKHI